MCVIIRTSGLFSPRFHLVGFLGVLTNTAAKGLAILSRTANMENVRLKLLDELGKIQAFTIIGLSVYI